MSVDDGKHVTVNDLDIEIDPDRIDDSHPFEIGTRAGHVILVDTEGGPMPKTLSTNAALALGDEIQYAADHAAQYRRENNETEVSE